MFFNSLVEQKPIDWRNQTPPIIDHYPEGPGYTPPFQPPLQDFPSLNLPGLPDTGLGVSIWNTLPEDNPRRMGLAGRYMQNAGIGMGGSPIWAGALGGLLGSGLNFFGKRKRR
jgi:hypothetical protein